MSNYATIAALALGAALLGTGAAAGRRITRGTLTVTTRARYSHQLARAAARLKLFERSLHELRLIRTATPPRLFTLDTDEVEEVLRRLHRRETAVCAGLALLNATKTATEVPMTAAQVLRQRKLGRRFDAAVAELRKLELTANAKGVRLDRARPCRADAPNIETMQRAIEERNERRARAKAKAKVRREQQQREHRSAHRRHSTRTVAMRLRELADEHGHDEEAFARAVADDHALLGDLAAEDPQVLVDLASDYPPVWEKAKALGLLDASGNLFQESL